MGKKEEDKNEPFKKVITQEEYDKLPCNGCDSLFSDLGEDGQPIIKYAQCNMKDSNVLGIERYWADKTGFLWKRASKFIPGNEY